MFILSYDIILSSNLCSETCKIGLIIFIYFYIEYIERDRYITFISSPNALFAEFYCQVDMYKVIDKITSNQKEPTKIENSGYIN